MTRKTDKQFGMHRAITRRGFVQGSRLAVLGAVTSGAIGDATTAAENTATALSTYG